MEAVTFERIRSAMNEDTEMIDLQKALRENKIPTQLKEYARYIKSGELSVSDGVILHSNRILIPRDLRSEVEQILHRAHQGVEGMFHAAQLSVTWTGLYKDLGRVRARCDTCNLNAKLNSNLPPRPFQDPESPFQMISLDYFSVKGKQWLVCVDRHSG